jgi:hypothetical protein
MRYLITFACYGARLHGDQSGSVDRRHNLFGARLLNPDSQRLTAARRAMLQDPYVMDGAGRAAVLAATSSIAHTAVGACWRPTFGPTTCTS